MKYIVIIHLLLSFGVMTNQYVEGSTKKSDLRKIVRNYIKNNKTIQNDCESNPYYQVYFYKTNDTLCFSIGAFLGVPGPVIPDNPKVKTFKNPNEIKGVCKIRKAIVVFYDFLESDGYGLYDPDSLDDYKPVFFEKIPLECVNVLYPEGWQFKVIKGEILYIGKRNTFKLK